MFSSKFIFTYNMAYPDPAPLIEWDRPGLMQGVTVKRRIEGQWYAWHVPYNGLATQATVADILRVSVMTVNNWVRLGKIKHVKIDGLPSAIPLSEVKRVKKALDAQGRLGRGR